MLEQVRQLNSVDSTTIKHSRQYVDYYHCLAHELNLCLVHVSKHPSLRNIIGVVKEVTSFFSGCANCSTRKHTAVQSSKVILPVCQKPGGLKE